MNIEVLNAKYRWTTNSIVSLYAEYFTEEQWDDFNIACVGSLIAEHRIADENLLQLFSDVYEVFHDEDKKVVFEDGSHTFLELVQCQLEEKVMPESAIFSATECLLSHGIEKMYLDNFLAAVISPEDLIKCSGPKKAKDMLAMVTGLARLVSNDESLENKVIVLGESWNMEYPVHMLEKYRCIHSTPSEMVSFLSSLSYEDFCKYQNSGLSCLFKPNPSIQEYDAFKKGLMSVAKFFEHVGMSLITLSGALAPGYRVETNSFS